MGQINSALNLKCPRCGKGNLFDHTGIWPRKGMFAMIDYCSNCNLKFEKEPGFFYGAMYLSYMLNIATFVVFTVAYYVFFEQAFDWRLYILGYVVFSLLLTKYFYRMSRSLWLLIMVGYEPNKKDN